MFPKILLSSILLLLSYAIFGQDFAIIQDKDGYVNVREEANINAKVIDKLRNGTLVYFFEPAENWVNVDYKGKDGEITQGYIYHDRLKFLNSFDSFRRINVLPAKVTFERQGMEVIISTKKFNKKLHQFTYVKDYPELIERIDNQEYYGKDGGLPETEYEHIIVKTATKSISLPKAALQNLYEPSLESTQVFQDTKSSILYIIAYNSDGAGSYVVVWKIVNGKYMDRFVTYGF